MLKMSVRRQLPKVTERFGGGRCWAMLLADRPGCDVLAGAGGGGGGL
jgi:hypothetical protein